jgi:hypothetical protein
MMETKKDQAAVKLTVDTKSVKALTLRIRCGLRAGDDGCGGGQPVLPRQPTTGRN